MAGKERVCVVTGVGPGNGASFSRRFAAEGYRVAMLARSEGRLREFEAQIPRTRGYVADVADAESVRNAFAQIRADPWRTNTLALLLCGQEAVRDMLEVGSGAVIVIGATASLRGGAGFAGCAPAKAAQRILAQSMARSLGPHGVHVAYLVIDGVIDIPRTRRMLSDKPDDFFLNPDRIADTVLHLAEQDRSAWTFEIDLRPFGESF
jgi:NAD(P)-dependent dehydrogenase (short-subunit alcohol dehydrogenase family)